MNETSIETIIQFVDYLLPDLTPSESSLYLYLLRHTYLSGGTSQIRIGKRTIAAGYGKGIRGKNTDFEHMTTLLKRLEVQGCLRIGDQSREGTLYTVMLPSDVPSVAERLRLLQPQSQSVTEDFFTDEEKRKEVFKRDNWACQYCGDVLDAKTATLDHYTPQCKGGSHTKDNLKTCCFSCNSMKSGKSFEEAAPLLLKSIRERRVRKPSAQPGGLSQ